MKQILNLQKLKVSPQYAQAIHTAVFYLMDNEKNLDLVDVKNIYQFKQSEKNNKASLELFDFILSNFNYEMSYIQMDTAINIMLIFINEQTQ